MSVVAIETTTTTTQAVAEWDKLFPKQVTETYTNSVTFMKQLTVVAISTITYLKNVFTEDNYRVENFGGLKLRVLKKRCRDELPQFLSNALSKAFEAFEKKYLHQLALCFYEEECKTENLIEYHIFEFSYNSDGVTMDVHSKQRASDKKSTRYSFDNVRERTMVLIRTCMVMMQNYASQLPDSYDISLRLYYNEAAPEGYQAPGFLSTTEAEDHLAPTVGGSLKVGFVETPYHKLTARSYFKDNMSSVQNSNVTQPSQTPAILTQNEFDDFEDTIGNSSGTGPIVVCPCNKADVDENMKLLTCKYCGCKSHAICYGVSSELESHCCVSCSDYKPQLQPTDHRLASLMTNKKRECLCIFRRALWWLGSQKEVSTAALVDQFFMSQVSACKLMKMLHSHGIFVAGDDDDLVTPRKINRNQLKQVMRNFFPNEESNIVDRLLAQTLSQEIQPDPVGDVLSPMEKINLQNATAMAKIIEHTTPSNHTQDSTLKQYREAILSNENIEDELPLSGNHNPVKDFEKIGKKTVKRKAEDKESKTRTGVITKRVRAAKSKKGFA